MKLLPCFAAMLAFQAVCQAAPRRPNVLVLLTDDQGWSDIGVQGATDFATPNIDSIAAHGVRFTSGYAAGPVCGPSRAGLITGRAPTRFGFEFNHVDADLAPFGLPVSERTAADLLREAGYATGHIGKWHLGCIRDPAYRAEHRGFDESAWFVGQTKTAPLIVYRHGETSAMTEPAGRAGARSAAWLFPDDEKKAGEVVQAKADYVDTAMAEMASDFVVRHQDRPWFLYVAFLTPHEPLVVPHGRGSAHPGLEGKRQQRAAMIAELDHAVGIVLGTLRETGLLDQTQVWFLSDNGAVHGHGAPTEPLRGCKGTLYEGGIRVPFLMQWPGGGIPAGKVVDDPVSALDVLPTALAAAGVSPPQQPSLDGRDLLPFLRGNASAAPHETLCWRYGSHAAVRRGSWKLVRSADEPGSLHKGGPTRPWKLYDLSVDVGEARDLSAVHPDRCDELRAVWEQWDRGNVPALWHSHSGRSAWPIFSAPSGVWLRIGLVLGAVLVGALLVVMAGRQRVPRGAASGDNP